jgi:hypothetical protein
MYLRLHAFGRYRVRPVTPFHLGLWNVAEVSPVPLPQMGYSMAQKGKNRAWGGALVLLAVVDFRLETPQL